MVWTRQLPRPTRKYPKQSDRPTSYQRGFTPSFGFDNPRAFSPTHYTASNESRSSSLIGSPDQPVIPDISKFIETSTPKPEAEKEVTPEPPLVNTPEKTFETAPFTTPPLRPKPKAPDQRIFTSDLQAEYNNDLWEQERQAQNQQLLRYLGDNNVPINKYDLHYKYNYQENYDNNNHLTQTELENETMAAQPAAAVQKEIMYLHMLHAMKYEGTTSVEWRRPSEKVSALP
ncbi:hypothetical protein BDD12DRAFT_903869 [Trichophaea hybrida]|nr:hypothetical protein BDD12DRAFT_903869 [Trichophaea hybrida]